VTHETFEDVVNLLVPELQRRGAIRPPTAPEARCARSYSPLAPSASQSSSGPISGY
jgi:hypothetical protein